MIRGLETSRAAMAWEQARAETIANNVANINSQGFKRVMAVGEQLGEMVLRRIGDQGSDGTAPIVGQIGHGAVLAAMAVDQTAGTILPSDNPLAVILVGAGEFTFERPTGPGYTRNGSFHRNSAGTLVTAAGYPVMVGGRAVGTGASAVEIQSNGSVVVDGQIAGRLDIRGGAATRLEVGAVEASNVDLARETTDLITALRSFQVNQRALQIQDQVLAKSVSDLGRV